LLADARQQGFLVNGLLIVQTLITTGMALLLARQGCGITGQYTAALLGMVFSFLVLGLVTYRLYPGLIRRAIVAQSEPALQNELWKLNRPMLIHNLCGRMSLLTDNIIIAALLGPLQVVPFFITQRMALLAQGQLQGIGNATWAALAELHFKEQRETFNRRLENLTSLVALFSVSCMAPIAAYNRHFVTFWVGPDHLATDLLTLLAVANGFLQAIVSLWGWVFCGTGQVSRLVPVLIAGTVVNLSLSILCTWAFGLPGPLLGTFASFILVYLWTMPRLLQQVFGVDPKSLVKAVALPLALGLPYGAGVWWFARSHVPNGWLGLATEIVCAGGIYLLLAWQLIFTRTERALWMERVRPLLLRSTGW
jgi:O-antigen/teichoic acid export membrane protein